MIKSSLFGKTEDGRNVRLYHLKNGKYSADITDFGATLVRFCGPDRDGNNTDVLLGFDNLEPYLGSIGYMGAVIGRFGNRIEKGKFRFPASIDSSVYTISEEELLWLLHGLRIEEIKHYKRIVS
jgi:aldose 1-epimerase